MVKDIDTAAKNFERNAQNGWRNNWASRTKGKAGKWLENFCNFVGNANSNCTSDFTGAKNKFEGSVNAVVPEDVARRLTAAAYKDGFKK